MFIYNRAKTVIDSVNSTLDKSSPSMIILATTTTVLAVSLLSRYFHKGWGKTEREQLGDLFLNIPSIRKKYEKDINAYLEQFKETTERKWKTFEPLHTSIPEEGWELAELIELIQSYSKSTVVPLEMKYISGTIYSKSLDKGYEAVDLKVKAEKASDLDLLSEKLRSAFNFAFDQSYLWNPLHADEFPVGACVEYQVVRMVAETVGGDPNEVMGFVTSGGTISLMTAIRSYRNWGMEKRGHKPGEGVVIASKSVHASVFKAGKTYSVNIVTIETDETGKIDLQQLQKAVRKYGKKVIAIIGSVPCYDTGVIDPIVEMGKIAQENGCGLHVDGCLGWGIVNNLEKHKTDYLKIHGVTSFSADLHKNGWAPKGSSVVIFKTLGEKNLAYYSIYSVPGWSGGIYGTPQDPGSQSCVHILNSLLAMLAIGKKGYQQIAQLIHKTTLNLAAVINEFSGELKLVAEPEVNVVAFRVDKSLGLQEGATYAFAKEMTKRNFVLNTLNDDRVHFCVTGRSAGDQKMLEQFKKAAKESLAAIKEENEKLVKEGKKFPGDAGAYCSINMAIAPDSRKLSLFKYVENYLFGLQGAEDAVRAYFLAQLNPYAKKS